MVSPTRGSPAPANQAAPLALKWGVIAGGSAAALGLSVAGGLDLLIVILIALSIAVVAGLAIAGLVRRPHPAIGLGILLLAVPLRTLAEADAGGFSVGLTEAAVPVALFWMVAFRRPGRFAFPRLSLLLAAFIALAALTAAWALELPPAFKEIAKWIEALVALLAAFDLARNYRDLRPLAVLAGLAVAAEAGVGLLQTVFALGPQSFLVGVLLRAYGTFEQPNPFAGYLGLHLPFFLAFAFAMRSKWRWAALAVWAAGTAAVVLSLSRGAWLGLAAGTAIVVWYSLPNRRRAAEGLGVVAAVAVLALGLAQFSDGLADRLPPRVRLIGEGVLELTDVTQERSPATFAIYQRLAFWDAAARMFTSNPLGGVGLGNFDERYPEFRLGRWDESLGHAHNFYLNLAAETGLLGLLPFLLFLLVLLVRAAGAASAAAGPLRVAALGALGSLIAFATHSLVDNVFVGGMGVLVGAAAGLALAADAARRQPK